MATKVYFQSPPHRHNPPLPDLQAVHPKARDLTYLSLSCKKPELRDCLIRRMLKGAPVPRDPLGCMSSGDLECAPLAWTSSRVLLPLCLLEVFLELLHCVSSFSWPCASLQLSTQLSALL